MPNGSSAERSRVPVSEPVTKNRSPMWNEPNTSMPQRRPSGSGTQTLKLAPDIRTTFQPSRRIVRVAAVHSRMMSKGWWCRQR